MGGRLVSVLVVDDSSYFRLLLRSLFDATDDFTVVGEARDAGEAIELARRQSPDVVVLDWEMPDRTGLAALPELRDALPDAAIVMYSSVGEPDAASRAIMAGADLYLDKGVGPEALVSSVRRVHARSRANGDDAGTGLRVLAVDDDPVARRLINLSLVLEGAEVVEAATIAEARQALSADFDAIVLDRTLPDGDGLELLPELAARCPSAKVLVCSNRDDAAEPAWVLRLPKADMTRVAQVLGALSGGRDRHSAAEPRVGDARAGDGPATVVHAVLEEWLSLCDTSPALGGAAALASPATVDAITALLGPGSTGWPSAGDLDALAPAAGASDERLARTVARLVLLRAAVHRRLPYHLGPADLPARYASVNDAIDRALATVVRRDVDDLHEQAHTDVMTGLLNRRAFERDIELEFARSLRYRHPFTLVVIDVDELKAVNDRAGHSAGDAVIRGVAAALVQPLRASDRAYRIGGDEFALLLTETPGDGVPALMERIETESPRFTWGAATLPGDTDDRADLLEIADRQLLARKQARS